MVDDSIDIDSESFDVPQNVVADGYTSDSAPGIGSTLTKIIDDGITVLGSAGINQGLGALNSAPGFPYGVYSPYPPGYLQASGAGVPKKAISGSTLLLLGAAAYYFLK